MPETAEEKADREARESRESRRGSGPTDEGRGVARKLLNKFRGRAEDALAQLADENRELRDDRRELREEVGKFKAPGTVILTADEAKVYAELKALGSTPKDLKAALDEVPTLRAKVLEHDRRAIADEAAPLLGWNPAALREVVADKKLEVSFTTVTVDGKTVKVPHVKPTGTEHEKTAPVPLGDYAKQHLATYPPALTAKASATPAAGANGRTATPMVEQGASSSTAPNGGTDAGKPRQPATSGNYATPGQLRTKQNAAT